MGKDIEIVFDKVLSQHIKLNADQVSFSIVSWYEKENKQKYCIEKPIVPDMFQLHQILESEDKEILLTTIFVDDDKIDLKPILKKATQLGVQAFQNGIAAIPAQDKNLTVLVQNLKVGQSYKIYKAWLSAWHNQQV